MPYRNRTDRTDRTRAGRRPQHRRRSLLALGAGALLVAAAVPFAAAQTTRPPAPQHSLRPTTAGEQRAAARLMQIRDQPRQLQAFMRALPKGADLHNHLSGAADTQLLISLAARDGLCIEKKTSTAVPGPCKAGSRPASDVRTDPAFRQQLLRAWSMKDFPAGQSGHDHFFATFDKFLAVTTSKYNGRLLANVANTAAANHQSYLETMVSPAASQAAKLAEAAGGHRKLSTMHARMTANGRLDRAVTAAQREADRTDRDFRTAAHCDTDSPKPGCTVRTRFISQALRAGSPAEVFAQLELGMRLAEKDKRFVAVNLVQPEDAKNSLRDYRLHMRMLDYLHSKYPHAHIALHAGELTPDLVSRKDLRFHIRAAVHTGHAERIGHGVDLQHEDIPQQLLHTMARRGVALEANLTSNDQILGVSGNAHPFQTYRRANVPVVLSTDDPGIEHTDISREYRRATTTYNLSYPELKDLARTSLEQAFLPGRSLWRTAGPRHGYRPAGACATSRPGTTRPTARCAALLRSSPKAHQEWQLESAFHHFEQRQPQPSRSAETG